MMNGCTRPCSSVGLTYTRGCCLLWLVCLPCPATAESQAPPPLPRAPHSTIKSACGQGQFCSTEKKDIHGAGILLFLWGHAIPIFISQTVKLSLALGTSLPPHAALCPTAHSSSTTQPCLCPASRNHSSYSQWPLHLYLTYKVGDTILRRKPKHGSQVNTSGFLGTTQDPETGLELKASCALPDVGQVEGELASHDC